MENNLSFEENMKNLEQIVTELEKGDLSLDKSVEKFETGIKLSKDLNKILENAEKKINILIQDGDEINESVFTNN